MGVCLHKFVVSDEVILAFFEKRQNVKPGDTGFPTWYRGHLAACLKCPQIFINLPPPYNPFVAIEEVQLENIVMGAPS